MAGEYALTAWRISAGMLRFSSRLAHQFTQMISILGNHNRLLSRVWLSPVKATHAEQTHPGARVCPETQSINQRRVGGWSRSF
jgi:hypothetical protein